MMTDGKFGKMLTLIVIPVIAALIGWSANYIFSSSRSGEIDSFTLKRHLADENKYVTIELSKANMEILIAKIEGLHGEIGAMRTTMQVLSDRIYDLSKRVSMADSHPPTGGG
jgi:hypothetical protein